MIPISSTATDAARRLWTSVAGDASDAAAVAAAAERLCVQLGVGLGRWIGTQGYHTLVNRARGLMRQEHPALVSLACVDGKEPMTAAMVETHGSAQVEAAMIALVATLIELLGRIIGEEMAMRLVEQTGAPSPRGAVSPDAKEERHG